MAESHKGAWIGGCATIIAAIITVVGGFLLQKPPPGDPPTDTTPAPTISSLKTDQTRTPNAKPFMTGDIDRDGVAERFFKDCSALVNGQCVISVYSGSGQSVLTRLEGNDVIFTEGYTNGYRDLIVIRSRGYMLHKWAGTKYVPVE
jgi:hypothetical protein